MDIWGIKANTLDYIVPLFEIQLSDYIHIWTNCYGGHILPYPKDGLVQPKHILRASSLGEDNFSFLTRHLTDRLQAENG